MKIIFRVDSSITMGSGHLMRCMTLANALRKNGATCEFICRNHKGNLIDLIKQNDYLVYELPYDESNHEKSGHLAHSAWLGSSQQDDIDACLPIIKDSKPDWVIIDHYALDQEWEGAIKPLTNKIMVIDDLADRKHDCDILLDQTYGRSGSDYKAFVSVACSVLCGAHYALLRPEFASWRELRKSASKMFDRKLRVLINLGGMDKDNYTGEVLKQLSRYERLNTLDLVIVMGSKAPWRDAIIEQSKELNCSSSVLIGVNNMAELMCNSDIAIGAAGSTSWERCCLGLPTIMLTIAENQNLISIALHECKAAYLTEVDKLNQVIELMTSRNHKLLNEMSIKASNVCDGRGVDRVVAHIYG